MKIAVVGTGYVGLVTGACFAEMGNDVICVDKDAAKVERMRAGECPIYEIGLPEMLPRNIEEGRLAFTTSLAEAAESCDIFFIAVGTNPAADGSADLTAVHAVAREIGETIQRPAIIVDKSTVPVGTGEEVEAIVREALEKRGDSIEFEVISNPEFLKEGAAVQDFMKPDRVIIGTDSEWARKVMGDLYSAFTHKTDRIIFMGRRDAEMTKYAANAMLATKISFMNEIASLSERLGVDVENVRHGIGSDPRIGYSFIYPGCGYGGSCFPKDVKALIHTAREQDFDPAILDAVEWRNAEQKKRLNEKVRARFGADLSGHHFALWGLAFKPGTDDMREAPSKVVLEHLIGSGATVTAHDPEAMDMARAELPAEWFESGRLRLVEHQYDALDKADALILVTEWKPYRQPDFDQMARRMKQKVIFDGRNQYDPERTESLGFEYTGIGRGREF
ncbi:UDP-glucose dehydrogenase family protein [Natronospira bacteriovora]|uniref:UDP-glucose 6-dehydrogenase n=1 Tax=Natronospira bacteriovora TaxID=3069753 RepID=A0ABU0W780_9GAMM|nr:UDP-glucose/GDP-mannose dehydrogenase family protein [Natronospira sp. AB-CW4]MDQ2069892.1 UDP-glucose/GDP-mannose dehydrogenase family protein [Natronospira sp. AB-CW4]